MNNRRFLYYRDPVFLTVVALYFLNRCVIKPLTLGHMSFFHSYFNDLICIPFWLPLVLFVHRIIRIRKHDGPPTKFEILVHLTIWSVFFELIGPHLHGSFPKTVGDPWDVVAYAVGTVIAAGFWGSVSLRPLDQSHQATLKA